MATIQETQQKLSQASQRAVQVEKSIPRTTQRQLRQQGGLEGRQKQQQLQETRQNIDRFKKDIVRSQKGVEKFLKTDAGKLRYAKETGVEGKKVWGKIARGYSAEVLAIEYDTPYGKVIDNSPRERALQRERKNISKLSGEEIKEQFPEEYRKALGSLGYDEEQLGLMAERGVTNIPIRVKTGVGDVTLRTGKSERVIETVDAPEEFSVSRPSMRKDFGIIDLPDIDTRRVPQRVTRADIRIETPDETRIRDEASQKGSIGGIIEYAKKGVGMYQEKVVVPISKSEVFKKTEEKVIRPLSENIYYPGIEKVGKTIESGVSKIKIKDKLEWYQEKVVVPVRETIPSLGKTPIGQIAEAKRYIEIQAKVDPTKKVIIGAKGREEVVEIGSLSGKGLVEFGANIFFREIEKTGQDIGRRTGFAEAGQERFGKGANIAVGAAALTSPLLFFGYTGSKITEAGLGGGFGGATSARQFVQENPMETAFVAGLGAGAITGRTTKLISRKGKLTREEKFLSIPERKITELKAETIKTVEKTTTKVPSIKIISKEQKLPIDKLEAYPKFIPKGKLKEISIEPTGVLKGTIEETRFMGKLRFSRKGVEKKLETFKGDITYDTKTGKLIEVVRFPKGIKRETIIDTKTGLGKVELTKGDTILSAKKFKQPESPVLKPSEEVSTIPIREESFNPLRIDEVIVKKGGKTLLKRRKITKGKDGIIKLETDVSRDLKSGLRTGERKEIIRRLESDRGTVSIVQKDVLTNIDEIIAGSRKGKISVKNKDGLVIERRARVGQKIEIGEDGREIDMGVLFKKRAGKGEIKQLSPKTDRTILEGIESTVRIEFLKTPPKKVVPPKKSRERIEPTKVEKPIKVDVGKPSKKETILEFKDKSLEKLTKLKDTIIVPKIVRKPIASKPIDTAVLENSPIQVTTEKQFIETSIYGKRTMGGLETGDMAIEMQEQKPEVSSIQKQSLVQDTISRQGRDKLTLIKQDIKQKQTQTQLQEQAQTQLQSTMLRQRLTSLMKTKQQLRQKTTTKITTRTPVKTTTKKTPPTVIVPTQEIPLLQRLAKKAKEEPGFFKVFTREGEKDIEIGTFKTKTKAKKFLTKELKGKLRASGFLEFRGKKVSFGKLGTLDPSFRQSKIDPFRVVEKKGRRLSRRSETKEIQFLRKKAPSKKRGSPFGL